MLSDEEVIKGILMRRSRAVEALYDRYAPMLLGISLRYCGNVPDAEDVLHDSFIKILKKLHTYKTRKNGTLTGWMRTIVVNTALNFLREQAKWNRQDIVPDASVSVDFSGDHEEEEFEKILDFTTREMLMDLVCRLPAGYRAVFNLYVFEDHSHRDIARILSIAETTSKSQLSKARSMLRKLITEKMKQERIIQ